MIRIRYALIVNILSLIIITGYYDNLMEKLHNEIFNLKYGTEAYYGKQEFSVTVTMYNPTRGQTDKTPNITADGTKINPHRASNYRYVALSRDLLSRWGGPFNYGDYVAIKGTQKYDGIYQVKDTMNPRFVHRVDILRTKGDDKFKYENIALYKYTEEQVADSYLD